MLVKNKKKIDINIPKLDDFIHKVYINVARKVYKNVYLFELNIPPLQVQKHNRELEMIVQECILNTLRESVPVEAILKAYMDETVEEDVVEEVKEQYIDEPLKQIETPNDTNSNMNSKTMDSKLSFNDIDYIRDENNKEHEITAPKTIERLEEISEMRAIQRKLEDEDEETNVKLKIHEEDISLDNLDIHVINEPSIDLLPDLIIDDIEVLE